ncbi:MAG: Phosphate-binding protein PstS precursor [Planctomycetes bacterium ADurb.Bin412]|nr:MAG: Phosphate-binding protein PstS precursor [Planctomycetes bacterium ADurb.Bin412]
MKKLITIALVGIQLVFVGCQKKTSETENSDSLRGTITVSGAWALYPMVVKWAEEFQVLHPEVKIDVAAGGAGKGMADTLAGAVDIGMVSRDINPAETEKGACGFAVTKDAVVPTLNASNPLCGQVLAQGIKKQTLMDIWIHGKVKNWAEVVNAPGSHPISVYTRSDACGAAEVWAKYLGGKQEDLTGVGVYGDPGLAEAVKKDALGIGYNNVNFAYDAQTKKPIEPLCIVPIDLNDNGQIDPEENFYGSLEEILTAIREDRYPSPPARQLYLVTKGVPQGNLVREFLLWILTDGQQYVTETGYINLKNEQLELEKQKLVTQ